MGNAQKAIIIGVVVLLFAVAAVVSTVQQGKHMSELKGAPLAEIYKTYKTKLIKQAPTSKEYNNSSPREVKEVTYTSEGQKLKGWLVEPELQTTKKAAKEKISKMKRPAVVYLHGGDAWGRGDYEQAARQFSDSGFIVFMPSMRGENGNPGVNEMCFGEVKDAMAAVEYVSKLPNVDKSLIFAAGHSIGGTNTMLLAEVCPLLKKAAACGGYPDMYRSGPYPDAPFEDNDKERYYRSPARFVDELKCPLLLMYGDKDKGEVMYSEQAEYMAKEGKQSLKKITVEVLPGTDHFSALEPAITRMIAFFRSN